MECLKHIRVRYQVQTFTSLKNKNKMFSNFQSEKNIFKLFNLPTSPPSPLAPGKPGGQNPQSSPR